MNNLSSYCGLVDAKIKASDKDLPVLRWPSDAQTSRIALWPKILKVLGFYQLNFMLILSKF